MGVQSGVCFETMVSGSARFELMVKLPCGKTVPVQITRKSVKRLNLRIRKDASVVLSVPRLTPRADVQAYLNSCAPWIEKHLERMQKRTSKDSAGAKSVLTEILPLWGKPADAYQVLRPFLETFAPEATLAKVSAGFENGICFDGTNMTPNTSPLLRLSENELNLCIRALYQQEVVRALPAVAARYETIVGVSATRWSVRTMSSRWGSCTPASRSIRINTRLAAYPPMCLEATVAHELVHLLEANHSARFHALLDQACPDNREARKLLKHDAWELVEGLKRET